MNLKTVFRKQSEQSFVANETISASRREIVSNFFELIGRVVFFATRRRKRYSKCIAFIRT